MYYAHLSSPCGVVLLQRCFKYCLDLFSCENDVNDQITDLSSLHVVSYLPKLSVARVVGVASYSFARCYSSVFSRPLSYCYYFLR